MVSEGQSDQLDVREDPAVGSFVSAYEQYGVYLIINKE